MARQNVYAYRINSSERIDVSTTSAQSGTTPFGCNVARITAHGTSGAPLTYFKIGKNPTALTDGTSSYIHENDLNFVSLTPDSSPGAGDGDKIAAISSSGTAYVFIDWLEG